MKWIGVLGSVASVALALGCGGPKSDPRDPNIIVSDVQGQTTEAGGSATLTVSVDGPPVDVLQVGLSSDNTAEGTLDVSIVEFTQDNWEAPQTVTITGVNDDIDDGDQAYQVLISNLEESRDVINIDDDESGLAAAAAGGGVTDECGTQDTIDFVLTSEPVGDVVLSLLSSDETEGTIDLDTLTFTAADWDVPQTVTVTGMNDVDSDGDMAYGIDVVDIASEDPLYDGLIGSGVAMSNLDNEGNTVTLSATQRGWWNDAGNHTETNDNTFTGFTVGNLYNSYFTFDLSSVAAPAGDAILRLEIESYYGADANEDLSIWDVTTDAATLEASGSGVTAIYDDLMSGVSYGSDSVLAGAVGGVEEMVLNDAATADINAAAGLFSVGVHVDTVAGDMGNEGVRFSSSTEARTHQLVLSLCQ